MVTVHPSVCVRLLLSLLLLEMSLAHFTKIKVCRPKRCKDMCPALPVRISSHLATISLVSAVGKSVTRARHVSPHWRSMMESCCSNCHCCGSAQMVQQQMKLVATFSGVGAPGKVPKEPKAWASSNSANTDIKRLNQNPSTRFAEYKEKTPSKF